MREGRLATPFGNAWEGTIQRENRRLNLGSTNVSQTTREARAETGWLTCDTPLRAGYGLEVWATSTPRTGFFTFGVKAAVFPSTLAQREAPP